MPATAGGLARYVENVLRTLTARLGPAADTSITDVPPVLDAVRILVLVVVLITVPLAEPHLGKGADGIGVAVSLGVATVSWVVWLLAGRRARVTIAALAVMGVAGGVLAGLSPLSTAIAVGCVVTSTAGVRLNPETSLAITAGTVAAFLAAALATGAPTETLLGYPLTFIGLWAFGLSRHAFLLRAEQAERMLAETHRAREAETQAAALAERARIAREIHDVLAHSLAAVSVNLQAAEGLLGALPAGSPELAKAIECIGRAGVFTREGLADARRAIMALRDDADPLADQLSALAQEYRADGDVAIDFTVTGVPRPVAAEAALAAYRTAQEALTNARKHAPGQPVRLSLEFTAAGIAVRVANPVATVTAGGPLAATGAQYGLTGLRERAALGGGTLAAGPADGEWRVALRIPA
jgi:signal transduction histidine kinase